MRQHLVGRDRASTILDAVQELGHVTAMNGGELAPAPVVQNVLFEISLDIVGRPQALLLDVTLEPVLVDLLEALRTSPVTTTLNVLDDLPSLLARLRDLQ